MLIKNILYILLILAYSLSQSIAADSLQRLYAMPLSGLFLVNAQGETVLAKRQEQSFVPASTVKIITALMALEHWGSEHRFQTRFYFEEKTKTLIVQGLGDPMLISEELDLIVSRLKDTGIQRVNKLVADTSYFSDELNIADQGKTSNPYDASASALAVNFNTINVNVSAGGVESAEPQTPMTPLSYELTQRLPEGNHRINLGMEGHSANYFLQVLAAKMRAANIQVAEFNNAQRVVEYTSTLMYEHKNSHTLSTIISAMLEYSNNFIANQLFLLLGAELIAPPASLVKSQTVVSSYLQEKFNWSNFVIRDGAGLSRENQLSADQLIQVLREFTPYRNLLPQQDTKIFAKSGTLSGVSCYAGFLYRDAEWQRFAILINQPVDYRYREQLARDLLRYP